MEKNKAIKNLISQLSLEFNELTVVDYWESDLSSVGISGKGSEDKLIYISTYETGDKYYYELEKSTPSEETKYVSVETNTVDYHSLVEVVRGYLFQPEVPVEIQEIKTT